jgi:serine/threonine protein kinase
MQTFLNDDSDSAVSHCQKCGKAWPAETTACLSCGADLGGETVLNHFHQTAFGVDTELHVRRDVIPAADAHRTGASRISSGQITAASSRAPESADPPTAQPASDPTTSTKLDTSFIHLVPGTLVGEYEIEKLLGSGGMGAVYGARHERLRKKAAIKVIAPNLSADQSAVERFEQEALALAQLSHPNIVAVLSIGTLPGDGRSYYLMEWLEGESLHDRLERGRVPYDDALDMLDQIARGLDAAHAAGIVHRDLKPDNCWLQEVRDETRRIVKILDLGLAKLAEHRRSEETAVNVMFGTPSYMSPEQCRSARDVGPATDVYALGCIAYELLCGRLPFAYDNGAELVVAHGSEVPPAPRLLNPAIPPDVNGLLTGMLAKDPTHRPTLAQVRRTITNALTARAQPPEPIMAAAQPIPASSVPIAGPHAGRRVFVALAGVVVLGAIIVAAVVGSSGAKLDNSPRVVEQPNSAIEIDTGVPPTATALTATVPTATVPSDTNASSATATPRIDASTGTSDRTSTPIRSRSSTATAPAAWRWVRRRRRSGSTRV